MIMARALQWTKLQRYIGTEKQRSKEMQEGKLISVICISTVKAFHRTILPRYIGTEKQPNKEMQAGKIISVIGIIMARAFQ